MPPTSLTTLVVVCSLGFQGCLNYPNSVSDSFKGKAHAGPCPQFLEVERSLKEETKDKEYLTTAFKSLSCYDGGNLEDIYRAIGEFFTREPIIVLSAMHDAQLEMHQISSVFTMLPLSFVDKPCKRVSELNRRKIILEKYDNYPEERKIGLLSIRKSLSRMQKHYQTSSDLQ